MCQNERDSFSVVIFRLPDIFLSQLKLLPFTPVNRCLLFTYFDSARSNSIAGSFAKRGRYVRNIDR
jgi:hypothetical protein